MDIIIKKATIENLKDIQTLNNKLFELEYENFDVSLKVGWPFTGDGKEYFEEVLNNGIVFIALVNDEVIGYLAGSLNIETSYVTKTLAELDNMYILEEYRKYGVGTKLINEFKKHCQQNKIQEIKVTASAKNSNAISFYKKNGFEDFEVTFKTRLNPFE